MIFEARATPVSSYSNKLATYKILGAMVWYSITCESSFGHISIQYWFAVAGKRAKDVWLAFHLPGIYGFRGNNARVAMREANADEYR